MKVSVIVPNYNHAAFLARRLDTILGQTFSDFELIILDDCSTDNSRAIIEQYRSHPKVAGIYYNAANSGSSFKQWEKGISLAKGEWVWMAESDDWCETNFLEELISGLSGNKDCVLAYAQSYCVDDNGIVKWKSEHKESLYINGKEFFRTRLVYGCTVFNASMAIFKKEAALHVPADFTGFRQCGDWYFWMHLVQSGDVFISPKLLNHYRNSGQSLTSRLHASGYNFIEELKMFDLLQKEQKQNLYFFHKSIFNRYNSFMRRRERFTGQEQAAVFNAFSELFGGNMPFRLFLFKERIQLLHRKIQLKLKVLLTVPAELKTGIF